MYFLQRIKEQWPYLLGVFVFAISAIYVTYPLIFHMGEYATNLRDELLISWIHVAVIQNIVENPLGLFQGNMFYPYKDTLAYSDLHFASALLSAPSFWLTGQPISTINTTLILSLFLLGISAYFVTYSLTKNIFAGIIAGFLIQFSPVTLDKNVHVQALAIAWVILSVFFYIRWLQSRRFIFFLLALVFFLIQTWNSFLPGYFILFSFVSMSFICILKNKKHISYYFQKKHALAIVIAAFLLLPIVIPYMNVSNEFSFRRDIREVVHLSLQPEDLFYPNDLTRLWPILQQLSRPSSYPEHTEFKAGYIGFAFSLLSIVTVWYCVKNRRKLSLPLLSFVIIALLGLVMSFGPVLHLERKTVHIPFVVPLPYALFYYSIPGFQGIRAAYRWEMLFVLFMAIGSGLVIDNFSKKFSSVKKILLFLLITILIVAEYNPMRFVPVPQVSTFPPVYNFIRNRAPNAAIVEMPIYNWSMAPYSSQELMRVYYSSIHAMPMLNGASGFSPPPWQKMVTNLLRTFPSEGSIKQMKKLGIEYIIVHSDEYDRLYKDAYAVSGTRIKNGTGILLQLRRNNSISEIKHFSHDYVFAIK